MEDDFLQNVRDVSSYLEYRLNKLLVLYPKFISQLKGLGLLRGIGLTENLTATDLSTALRTRGILTVPAGLNTLRILPPLIITKQEIDVFSDALTECFEEAS